MEKPNTTVRTEAGVRQGATPQISTRPEYFLKPPARDQQDLRDYGDNKIRHRAGHVPPLQHHVINKDSWRTPALCAMHSQFKGTLTHWPDLLTSLSKATRAALRICVRTTNSARSCLVTVAWVLLVSTVQFHDPQHAH